MMSCARGLSLRPNAFVLGALAAALVAFAGISAAEAGPITGDYKSVELGGSVLMGRWSEGFINGNPNHVRNGAHAASWDGANLGNQWEMTGAVLAGMTTLFGNPGAADGTFIVKRDFDVSAAHLLLKSDGGTAPWWGGDGGITEYDFALDVYFQVLTVTVAGGAIMNATSTEVFEGTYVADPLCQVHYGHTVGIYEGVGPQVPTDYPGFEAALEGVEVIAGGAWGTVEGTRFTITPEPATLAMVGIGLAAMGLRRRK